MSDNFARVEHLELGEVVEAPFHDLGPFGFALGIGREARNDRDEPLAVLDCRADEAVSRFRQMPGFHAVRADVGRQQWIAIDELVLAVVELLLGKAGIHLGVFANDVAREKGQFANRHEVFGGRKSCRVAKLGLFQPDPARFVGHEFGKRCFRAGHSFSDGDGRVVARLDDDALKQLVQFHLGVEWYHHGRRARGCTTATPRVLAHQELVIELDRASLECAKDDGERHQLAHAGGRDQFVGLELVHDGARLGVHQDGMLGFRDVFAVGGCRSLRLGQAGGYSKVDSKSQQTQQNQSAPQ